MITRFFAIIEYIARIPPVAKTREFFHNLPRAVRAWAVIIAVAAVGMLGLGAHAVYLFVLYAGEAPADAPVPSAVVSVQEVRDLVGRIQEREASFVAPEVSDPSI